MNSIPRRYSIGSKKPGSRNLAFTFFDLSVLVQRWRTSTALSDIHQGCTDSLDQRKSGTDYGPFAEVKTLYSLRT